MNESLLVILFSVLVSCAILASAAVRFGRRLFPRSAFQGFASAGEPFTHFRAAIRLMCARRWLLWLPLGLVLATFILRDVPSWWRLWSDRSHWRFSPDPIPFASYLDQAFLAAASLWHGYLGSLNWDLAPLSLALVLFLLMLQRLKGVTAEENSRGLSRVAWACWAALGCLLVTGIALLFLGRHGSFHGSPPPTCVVIGLMLFNLLGTILDFCLVFPLALLGGWLLVYMRGQMRGEEMSRRTLWNQALCALAPLARLGVLWFLVLTLPGRLWYSLADIRLCSDAWAHFYNQACPLVNSWFYYQEVIVSLAFCLAPFFVIVNGGPAGRALLGNLAFIRERFLKWAILIGLAIFFLAAGGVLRLLLHNYFAFPQAEWWALIPQLVRRVGDVIVRAACGVALFDFFLHYGATDTATPPAAGPALTPS